MKPHAVRPATGSHCPAAGRRGLLQALLAGALAPLAPARADGGGERFATAWQAAATSGSGGFFIGWFTVNWQAEYIALGAALAVPARAHGLLALTDGGFVAVAQRPGQWLWRVDALGQVAARADGGGRSFNGHVDADPSGTWIFTTETNAADGTGWVSVRDPRTLARVAEFRSGGIEPHQLLHGADGTLMVANGGIVRDAAGRKAEGAPMTSSLARIQPGSGALLDRWTLPDTQLSVRHIAWSTGPEPLLGVALQAEHDDARARAAAPVLAVWNGQSLALACTDTVAAGYAGDIAAGPAGGFVLSAQKQRRALWWHPARPDRYSTVAEVTEPCALAALDDAAGVTLGAGRGLARWRLEGPPAMLPWPIALAPDNHMVRLL